LKRRGHFDGKLILKRLGHYKWENAKAISSPAKRAYDTALIITSGLGIDLEIDTRLYFEGEEAMLSAVVDRGYATQSLFCFGHQPDIASLYSQLSGNFLDHIPTTGVAILDFDISDWSAINSNKGATRALLFPKMFK
jgi:phosphohistidine phosphatase